MSNLENGMDTARIREVADQLRTQAAQIGEVQAKGTQQQGTLKENWFGADSDQFGENWQTAAKQLQAAQSDIEAYAKLATDNAQQQDDASAR